MKHFIVTACIIVLCSCHKSQTEKQQKINCGCETDSVLNVVVDSTGWFGYDSSFKQYYIIDSGAYNFRYVFWICNPELNDVTSVPISKNPDEVYYSGKVKERCPDSIITIPEEFLLNITIDSLRKK